MDNGVKRLYEFGLFRMDPQRRLLLRDGQPVSLTPKAFDTLLVLVQNNERVVSKDDLMKAVWSDSFVEESNLSQNIFTLRKALGDSGETRRYIVTVPGRGYQFTEKVHEVSGESQEQLVFESHSRSRVVVEPAGLKAERLVIAAGAAILLIALIATGVLTYQARRSRFTSKGSTAAAVPTVTMRRSVAVLGFRNLTGRPDQAWLSTALAEMLSTELAAGEQLRMVPGEQVARARRVIPWNESDTLAKDSLARLRSNLETDYITLGSYTVVGEGSKRAIRLDLRLQDAATGEIIAEEAVTGNESQLFELVSRAGSRLRERLKVETVSDEQDEQIRAALPASLKAARLYAEGLARLRVFDALAARHLLERAVAIDPNHALSHSALAESLWVLGYDAKARQEAKKALELSHSLSRADRLSVEGRYRVRTNDFPAAIEIYRVLSKLFPDDIDYTLHLASAQRELGRHEEALATIGRLRSLPAPANRDARIDAAEAAVAESRSDFKGSLQAATMAVAAAEAQGNHLVMAYSMEQEAWAWNRLGDPDKAIAAYSRARELWIESGNPKSAATALHGLAHVQYDTGNLQDARKSFEAALEELRRIGAIAAVASCSHNLGVLFNDQGDLRKAKEHFEEALRIQRALKDERGVASDLDDLSNVLSSMGDLATASRMKEEAWQTFHRLGNRMGESITLLNLGEVCLAQGKLARATEMFERSKALGQESGYRKIDGYNLFDVARVLMARDRLEEARASAEQALALRKELRDESTIAESQVQLAAIALEQGKAAEAESLARAAGVVFDKQNAPGTGARSYAVLTRALAAQGKTPEAYATAARALTLSRRSGDLMIQLEAALAAADAKVDSGRLSEATRELEAAHAKASRYGYAGYEMETRLHLGLLEVKAGRVAAGRQRLQQLHKDARAKDFLLIARKAARALGT